MIGRSHLLALADSSVLETGLKSVSPDRFFVGSSGFPRDIGTTVVPIPAAALPGNDRYFFCLASYYVPRGRKAILWGIRQLLTIGNVYPIEDTDTSQAIDIPVTGEWAFPDGNVAWHLTWIPGNLAKGPNVPPKDPTAPVFAATGLDSAGTLLYTPPFAPYVAPNGGLPPGQPILGFGTFYEIRFPLESHGERADLAWECPGGGAIALFASVKQTDPATRVVLDIPSAALPYVRREDAFVQTMSIVVGRDTIAPVYRGIAGGLLLETDFVGKTDPGACRHLESVK